MDGYKMRWIYELMWLWQSIGIILLILAIFECCAALIFMKKRYHLHMAICIAIAAFIIAVIFILRLAGTPMPL